MTCDWDFSRHGLKAPCVRCSKATQNWASMFHCVQAFLSRCDQKLQFWPNCPEDLLPEGLWFVNVHFSKFQSFLGFSFKSRVSLVFFHGAHFQKKRLCNQTLTYLELRVHLASLWQLCFIYIILLLNLGSIFRWPPRSGRLAPVAWMLNSVIIFESVVTGTENLDLVL